MIRRHELSAKKSLGQNFLLDLNLTGRIARAAGPLEGVTVVEIGPGPGGLTRALLAEGARRVIAIERDERALAALGEIAEHYPGPAHGRRRATRSRSIRVPHLDGGPVRIVANLPYNIATVLLIGWLTAEPWPPWYDRMVLMFQREVAERIVAAPGSKTYGRLSVLACVARAGEDPVRREPVRVRAAAEGHVVGGRSSSRAPSPCPATAPRWSASPKRPSASAARCCARASNRSASIRCRCSRPPASSPPRAPKTFRSKVLPPSRAASNAARMRA